MTKLWFRRKRYGWGWTPASYEGWVITAAAVAGIVWVSLRYPVNDSPVSFTVGIAAIAIVLVMVGYAKGERPRWQWGGR